MATAFASGPIAFTNSSGQEFYIPLDVIRIDANGALKLDPAYVPADNAAMTSWVQYLFARGEIVALPEPPPAALDLVATKIGAGGNGIRIGVQALSGTSTYAVTATKTETFSGLASTDVEATVNAVADGLVRVTAPAGYLPPYEQTLEASAGELTSDSALVLATSSNHPDAALTRVSVDAANSKLVVTWQKRATIATAQAAAQIAEAFALVSVTSGSATLAPKDLPQTDFDPATHALDLPAATGTALTLTWDVLPVASDADFALDSVVSAEVTAGPSSFDLTITRTDTFTGANVTPAKLAAGLGTRSVVSSAPTSGSITGSLVLVRTNGATPPASFTDLAAQLAVRASDGRFEVALEPDEGLAIEPTDPAMAGEGTWSITATPTGATTFSLAVSWSNSATVDTTKTDAEQKTAIADAIGLLATPTTHAPLVPLGGTYSLTGGTSTSPAKLTIPARP